MMELGLSACLDEYEKLVIRMSKPRVVIDNEACPTATVVKIDSARSHGILLEAVQVLVDLNLSIKKAYISSDGRWYMNVFHVTDLNGSKLTDENLISYIEQSIESSSYEKPQGFSGLTGLELTGSDRMGLLSEVFAVLAELDCNVVGSKVWTHNGRIASLIYLKDHESGSPIEDCNQIDAIKARLRNVLKGDDDVRSNAKMCVSIAGTHTERRLHQLMFEDRDYEKKPDSGKSPVVTMHNCAERGYSVVNVQCKDRPKLFFDVVCTLTDMEYVVFHATVHTASDWAYLEFYIRCSNGTPISSQPEMQRVIQCLQAAIERRTSEGLRLELCTADRQGLLASVTRTFRENGLNVTRAEVSTRECVAHDVFYVSDSNGNAPDPNTMESVREKVGPSELTVVKGVPPGEREEEQAGAGGGAVLLALGGILKRNLSNWGLIKSYF